MFPPPLCRSPKQGAAPQRGDYATATGEPADPVPPARAPQSPDEERSGRQLCLMHNCGQLLKAKWRRGVGRLARQSGGELLGLNRTFWCVDGTSQAYPYCTGSSHFLIAN
jgi:hypothetical protein